MSTKINGQFFPKQTGNYGMCSENMDNSFGAVNNLSCNYNSEMNQFTEENNIHDILDDKKLTSKHNSLDKNNKINTFGKSMNHSPTNTKDKKHDVDTIRESINHNTNEELNNSNHEKLNKILNEQENYKGCRNIELEKLLSNESFNTQIRKANDQVENNIEEFELTLVKVTKNESNDKYHTTKNLILDKIPYKKSNNAIIHENLRSHEGFGRDEEIKYVSNYKVFVDDEKVQYIASNNAQINQDLDLKYNMNPEKKNHMMDYMADNYDVYRTNLDRDVCVVEKDVKKNVDQGKEESSLWDPTKQSINKSYVITADSIEKMEAKQNIGMVQDESMGDKNDFSPKFPEIKGNVRNSNNNDKISMKEQSIRQNNDDHTMDLNNDSRIDSFGGNVTKNTGLRMEDLSPISNNLIEKGQNFHLQSFRDQQDTENSIFLRDKSFNEPISYIEEIKQGFSLTNESFNNKSSDRIQCNFNKKNDFNPYKLQSMNNFKESGQKIQKDDENDSYKQALDYITKLESKIDTHLLQGKSSRKNLNKSMKSNSNAFDHSFSYNGIPKIVNVNDSTFSNEEILKGNNLLTEKISPENNEEDLDNYRTAELKIANDLIEQQNTNREENNEVVSEVCKFKLDDENNSCLRSDENLTDLGKRPNSNFFYSNNFYTDQTTSRRDKETLLKEQSRGGNKPTESESDRIIKLNAASKKTSQLEKINENEVPNQILQEVYIKNYDTNKSETNKEPLSRYADSNTKITSELKTQNNSLENLDKHLKTDIFSKGDKNQTPAEILNEVRMVLNQAKRLLNCKDKKDSLNSFAHEILSSHESEIVSREKQKDNKTEDIKFSLPESQRLTDNFTMRTKVFEKKPAAENNHNKDISFTTDNSQILQKEEEPKRHERIRFGGYTYNENSEKYDDTFDVIGQSVNEPNINNDNMILKKINPYSTARPILQNSNKKSDNEQLIVKAKKESQQTANSPMSKSDNESNRNWQKELNSASESNTKQHKDIVDKKWLPCNNFNSVFDSNIIATPTGAQTKVSFYKILPGQDKQKLFEHPFQTKSTLNNDTGRFNEKNMSSNREEKFYNNHSRSLERNINGQSVQPFSNSNLNNDTSRFNENCVISNRGEENPYNHHSRSLERNMSGKFSQPLNNVNFDSNANLRQTKTFRLEKESSLPNVNNYTSVIVNNNNKSKESDRERTPPPKSYQHLIKSKSGLNTPMTNSFISSYKAIDEAGSIERNGNKLDYVRRTNDLTPNQSRNVRNNYQSRTPPVNKYSIIMDNKNLSPINYEINKDKLYNQTHESTVGLHRTQEAHTSKSTLFNSNINHLSNERCSNINQPSHEKMSNINQHSHERQSKDLNDFTKNINCAPYNPLKANISVTPRRDSNEKGLYTGNINISKEESNNILKKSIIQNANGTTVRNSIVPKNYAELFHSQGHSPIRNVNSGVNFNNYVSSNQFSNNTPTNMNSVSNHKYFNNPPEYTTQMNRSNSYVTNKQPTYSNMNTNVTHASNDYNSKSTSIDQNNAQRMYLKKDIDNHVKYSNVKVTPKSFVRKNSNECYEASNNYNATKNLYNTVNSRLINGKEHPRYFESNTYSKSPIRDTSARLAHQSNSNRLTLDTTNVQTTRPDSLFSTNTNLKHGTLTTKGAVYTQNSFNNQKTYGATRNDTKMSTSNRIQRDSYHTSQSPLQARINLPNNLALNNISSKKVISQTINHSRNPSTISQNTTPAKLRPNIKPFMSLKDYCLNDISRNNNAPNICYVGDLNRGKRIGYGKLFKKENQTHNNKRIYEGFFLNNIFEGFGYQSNIHENDYKRIDSYENINVRNYWKSFEGKFINGLPKGNGRLNLVNDDLIEGTFEDGFQEGKAVLYKKIDGSKILCNFKKDMLTSYREIRIQI